MKKSNTRIISLLAGLALLISISALANQEIAKKVMPAVIMLLLGDEDLKSGKIIDACVSNLSYKTSSGVTGRTNTKCEFNYREGDSVEFFVGGQSLGVIEANDFILAYDMANFSQSATLLQSIDSDGVPSNGIQVGTVVDKALESLSYTILDVDPNDSGFKSQFRTLTGREFVSDIEGSVQHSINAPRAEWIKQLNLSDYYLGKSSLIGCGPSQPCNNNFLLGTDRGSSFKRLQHYFWSYQIAPLMFLQERAMVGESFNTLEQKRIAEEKAALVADVFAAGMAVAGNPNDIKAGLIEGAEDKVQGLVFEVTEDYVKEFLVDNGHLWSAGAIDGVLKGGRVLKACLWERIIEKASAATCYAQFSEEVYQVLLNGITAWKLHQNQEKINAYSAALDYLTAWYNSGGKFEYIQTQSAYGFASNNQELKDFFTDGRDIDFTVFTTAVADGLSLVNKKVREIRGAGLLDVFPEGDLGLIDINITDSFIVESTSNYFGFCYEIENLSHDTVAAGNGNAVIAREGGGIADVRPIVSDPTRPNGNLILYNLGDKYQDCKFVDLYNDSQSKIFVITLTTDYERSGNTYNQNTSSASYQQSFEVGINERLELGPIDFQLSLANKEQTVEPNQTVNLEAFFEVDTIGATYQWKIITPSGITLNNATAKEASFVAPQIPLGENVQYVRGTFRATAPSGESELKTFSVNVVSETANLPQPPDSFTATYTEPNIQFEWVVSNPPTGALYRIYLASKKGVTPVNYQSLPDGQMIETSATGYSVPVVEGKTYYAIITQKLGETESAYRKEVRINASIPPPVSPTGLLNDTGITWGGDYPSGNNATCTNNMIIGSGPNAGNMLAQDCNDGRDATHNDNSDGHAGFSFTKISASGTELPAAMNSWSCVKDNVTGLIWEVKTDDGGIHDKDNTYRWGGITREGANYGTYYNDWDTLVNGSNAGSGLCGYTDWRVPSINELEGLANLNQTNPAIDTAYFPNTPASPFWSASPYASNSDNAWLVYFYGGDSYSFSRSYFLPVRLVRSGQ